MSIISLNHVTLLNQEQASCGTGKNKAAMLQDDFNFTKVICNLICY